MDTQEIKLPSFKKKCTNLIDSKSLNNKYDHEQQQAINNNCFIIIKIQQPSLHDFTILKFSLKIEENKSNQLQNNTQNDQNLSIQQDQIKPITNQIKDKSDSQIDEQFITNVAVSNILFIFFIAALLYKKCKKQQTLQVNNAYQNVYPDQQILPQINENIQLEQKNKKLISQRRLLQDKLNPIILFHLLKSKSQSIQEIYDKNNSQIQNNKDKGITPIFQSEYNQHQLKQQFETQSCIPETHNHFIKELQKSYNKENNQNPQQSICQKFQSQFNLLQSQQPKHMIQQSVLISHNQQCCAICLTEFVNEEKVRKTICNHIFHIDCLSNWLDKSDNCPLCRQSFEIMDMIDYLTIELCKINIKSDYQISVVNERNKIQSLLDSNNEIIILSDEQFTNVFSYFFPQNQIYQFIHHEHEVDTPINFSPLLNFQTQISQLCDYSSFQFDSENINNNSDESQISEELNQNDLFKNLEHLKVDEIIDVENHLNRSVIYSSLEKINYEENKRSKTFDHISIDLSENFNQNYSHQRQSNKIKTRLITIPQLKCV